MKRMHRLGRPYQFKLTSEAVCGNLFFVLNQYFVRSRCHAKDLTNQQDACIFLSITATSYFKEYDTCSCNQTTWQLRDISLSGFTRRSQSGRRWYLKKILLSITIYRASCSSLPHFKLTRADKQNKKLNSL